MGQIHITNRNKRLLLIIKYLLFIYNIMYLQFLNVDISNGTNFIQQQFETMLHFLSRISYYI
jgi:hypothetical protein